MQTVLITGGTGLVGKNLSYLLKNNGYNVIHLSRTKNLNAAFPAYAWDVKKGTIEDGVIEKADYIVHLAGAGVADGRWTPKRKQLIIDSRVNSTRLIKTYLEKTGHRPKAIIAAAAIGYYGDTGKQLVTENTLPGDEGFLPESCIKWEAALDELGELDVRTVRYRIGVVLSTKGGALEKMLPSYKVNLGAYFGNGSQYYSWIHIDDLTQMFKYAIENENHIGIYNAVAPNPVTNKELANNIAEAMGKLALVAPAPSFALRFVLGEMADVVLSGSKISSEKIQNTGFQFKYSKVTPALKDLIDRGV